VEAAVNCRAFVCSLAAAAAQAAGHVPICQARVAKLFRSPGGHPNALEPYQGRRYFCDAGIVPPCIPSGSPAAASICRIEAD
jgi:hypothetical protein